MENCVSAFLFLSFSVVARWQFKFLLGPRAELIKCGPSKTLATTFYRLTLGFTLSTAKLAGKRRTMELANREGLQAGGRKAEERVKPEAEEEQAAQDALH